MDHQQSENGLTSYTQSETDLNQVERHQNEKRDAIFDFQIPKDDGSRHIHSNILMMRNMQGNTQTDHMDKASDRFAQQLGIHSITEQNQWMDNGFDATAEMTTLFLQSKRHVEEHDYD